MAVRTARPTRDWVLLAKATAAALVLLIDVSLILIGGAVASGLLRVSRTPIERLCGRQRGSGLVLGGGVGFGVGFGVGCGLLGLLGTQGLRHLSRAQGRYHDRRGDQEDGCDPLHAVLPFARAPLSAPRARELNPARSDRDSPRPAAARPASG